MALLITPDDQLSIVLPTRPPAFTPGELRKILGGFFDILTLLGQSNHEALVFSRPVSNIMVNGQVLLVQEQERGKPDLKFNPTATDIAFTNRAIGPGEPVNGAALFCLWEEIEDV